MTENRTTQYLTYLTGFKINELNKCGFQQAWIGIAGDDEIGKELILAFGLEFTPSSIFYEKILSLDNEYIKLKRKEIYGINILLFFELKDRGKKIMDHFLKGEYSLFEDAYKDRFFNKKHIPSSINDITRKHAVVHKRGKYKAMLATALDVSLDSINELDSILDLYEEIYEASSDLIIDDIADKNQEIDKVITYLNETPFSTKSKDGINIQ